MNILLIFVENEDHKYVSIVKNIDIIPKKISFPIWLWPFCYLEKYVHG